MIRAALSSVAVAGLLVGGWALAGEHCQKGASAAASGGGCGAKVHLSAEATKALSADAAYQRADELLKSWSQVPAKLAAMTAEDKTVLASAGQKMADHPAGSIIKPSIEFVRASLHTAVRLDKAAQDMCAAQCKLKTEAAAAAGAEPPKVCPKVAAAKLRMETSAGLVAKASELISVAVNTASCNGKGDDAQVKKVSDEGGCPHAKAAALQAAATTRPAITLVKGEADKEEGCPMARAAKLAAAAVAAATQPAVMLAKAEGDKPCPKALAAKADALINESGKLLAQWQEANVALASMDESTRTNVETACAGMMAKCPIGRMMPETLSIARELLAEASKLTAQCQAECAKNPHLQVSAELKELIQARCLLISAAINVLDRTCTMAKPAKQIASAQ